MKHYRTNKGLRVLYSILIAILAAALLGGAIFGVIKLVEFSNRETKKLNPSWTNGALDASGVYRKTNGSIYTKDAFGCQGLNVELPFDTSVTYQIYFYDNEGSFVSATGVLTGNFSEKDIPILATHARIVVTPKDDEDISWTEKRGYAKQLTITVLKDQSSQSVKKITMEYEDGTDFYYDYETPQSQSGSKYKASKPIAVEGFTKIVISTKVKCFILYGDKDGHKCTSYRMVSVGEKDSYAEGKSTFADFNTYTFEIPENAAYFRVVQSESAFDYGYISRLYLTV